MLYGLIEAVGQIRLMQGAKYVGFAQPASIPGTSFLLTLPNALPGSTSVLTVDTSGNIGYGSLGGSGTVTSVALSAPAIFSVGGSPITSSGTLSLTLASQSANTIFAAPSGTAGTPTFRAITYADVSSIVGTTASTLAAGNDSRLHTQNTDTGTTSQAFQLQTGSSGVKLKNNAGVLEIRNSADSAYADLTVNNLIVQGTTTTVNSETVAIADNILLLNSNVTSGTPTEDGGIQISRGASTNASLIWNESSDYWTAGLAGTEQPIVRQRSFAFTNASLSAGVYTATHGFNQLLTYQLYDNNNAQIMPDQATLTSTTVSVTIASWGTITGTYSLVVQGI